jgi:hypothetical protein
MDRPLCILLKKSGYRAGRARHFKDFEKKISEEIVGNCYNVPSLIHRYRYIREVNTIHPCISGKKLHD